MAEQRGSLFVTIIDCSDLFIKSSGQSAYQEPYCILKLGDLEVRTNTVALSSAATVLSPRWNQEFKLEAERSQVLKVQVLNKDVFQNDHFIGQIKLPVLQLPPHSPEELNIKLKKSKGKGTGKGSLHLIVEWHPQPVGSHKEESEDRKHKANQGSIGDAIARKFHLPKKAATGNTAPTAANKKVFGKPIDSQRAEVPLVLKLTLNVVDSKGISTEGLFRMSAPVAEVEALRELVESGKEVDWYSYDIHVVAGLIISFLLTLPEPLMTFELYDSLVSTYETVQDVKSRRQLLRKLFLTLPPGNRVTLEAILAVLHHISENASVNKMDAKNLGIVFGPALLRRATETPQQLIHDSPILIGLLSSMIEDVDFYTGRESREHESAVPQVAVVAPASAPSSSPPLQLSGTSSPLSLATPPVGSPLTLSSSGGSHSNTVLVSSAVAATRAPEVHMNEEQREKAVFAAASATGAMQAMVRDKGPSSAAPSRGNWTAATGKPESASKSPIGMGNKPAVPTAPLAAMRSERQPTPFTAALSSSATGAGGALPTAKDLKKTVPKAPLPHTPPTERRKVEDEDADPLPEREKSHSGKNLDLTGKHSRRESHGKKDKTSGKHKERVHSSASASLTGASAHSHSNSTPQRSAEVQNLLDSLDQPSTTQSFQQQQMAASVLAADGGPKMLRFDQARRSIQLSLDALSQLEPPSAPAASSSQAVATTAAPAAAATSKPPPYPPPAPPQRAPRTDDVDRPPSARRTPIPPPSNLSPLAIPPRLLTPPPDYPVPPIPSLSQPAAQQHTSPPLSPKQRSSHQPSAAPPRPLPTAPVAQASTSPTLKSLAKPAPVSDPLNPSPVRALPSIPKPQLAPLTPPVVTPPSSTGSSPRPVSVPSSSSSPVTSSPLDVPPLPSNSVKHSRTLTPVETKPNQVEKPVAIVDRAPLPAKDPAPPEKPSGVVDRPPLPTKDSTPLEKPASAVDRPPLLPKDAITPISNQKSGAVVSATPPAIEKIRETPPSPQPTVERPPSVPGAVAPSPRGTGVAPTRPVSVAPVPKSADQPGRRLSFTRQPDAHAEQLTRIFNIMREDIEQTRQLISTLLRDLSDGRLEDVIATTHLLKSLKKLLDSPPGSVNVNELLIEAGRPVQKPNLRDAETARRFQQFCSVAETTLAELLDTLDQIASGFYAEVYTATDRQQQLVRALSIAHMSRDFKVVVSNYFEVTQDESSAATPVSAPSNGAVARGQSTIPSAASPLTRLGTSFDANHERVQLAQFSAELMSLFRGELTRVLIIEQAVALAKVARNVKAILMMDAREAEYHNFEVPERPLPSPGAALSQGPYERMRLEAMSEMVRYSLSDIEHELADLGGRSAAMNSAAEIKPIVNIAAVAFQHLKAYLEQVPRASSPTPAAAPPSAEAVAAPLASAHAQSAFPAPSSRVPEAPLAQTTYHQEPDYNAEAEERQRLDMLKRTALLVSTNVVNNINYLIVELQSTTRTPESILQIARIASLIRKLMDGMPLPSDWKALVAPPAAYTLQSERDLQTLFTLCMTVFEEFKGFIFDIRSELQQCQAVADAVHISTQISGFAKVAESYFQPI